MIGRYSVCGYDMSVLHGRMLEILIDVDRICREQGIRYSLYGGSVIGAVRHRGFIPWDHDIDIALLRKDYERLRRFIESNPNGKLFFSSYHSEPCCPYNFGKIRLNGTIFVDKEVQSLNLHKGVFIDVHPIDNIVPSFLNAQVKLSVLFACAQRFKSGYCRAWFGVKKIIYRLLSMFPYPVLNGLRDASMKLFDGLPTKYVYKIAHPNKGIYPIPRSTFENLIEHSFENRMFFIPRDYDEFLRKRYGDYMEIPPEANQLNCCATIVECEL